MTPEQFCKRLRQPLYDHELGKKALYEVDEQKGLLTVTISNRLEIEPLGQDSLSILDSGRRAEASGLIHVKYANKEKGEMAFTVPLDKLQTASDFIHLGLEARANTPEKGNPRAEQAHAQDVFLEAYSHRWTHNALLKNLPDTLKHVIDGAQWLVDKVRNVDYDHGPGENSGGPAMSASRSRQALQAQRA